MSIFRIRHSPAITTLKGLRLQPQILGESGRFQCSRRFCNRQLMCSFCGSKRKRTVRDTTRTLCTGSYRHSDLGCYVQLQILGESGRFQCSRRFCNRQLLCAFCGSKRRRTVRDSTRTLCTGSYRHSDLGGYAPRRLSAHIFGRHDARKQRGSDRKMTAFVKRGSQGLGDARSST